MAKRSAFGRKTRGSRRRPSAPRFTSLCGEALEPRQLLAYIALQDTPLVVGDSWYANGTVLIAPSHGTLVVRSEGGFTYTPEAGYTGTDRISIGVGSGEYDPTVYVVPPPSNVDDTHRNVTLIGNNSPSQSATYAFSTADFVFGNTSFPVASLIGVKITTLPTFGTLTDRNQNVTAGQMIPRADITGGYFQFDMPAPGPTVPSQSLLTIQDQYDTGGGSTTLDPAAKTVTFSVQQVNQPPSGEGRTVVTPLDTAYTLTVGDFGFTDRYNFPPNNFVGVKVTVPTSGVLRDDGVALGENAFVPMQDIAAGKLAYIPAAGQQGQPYPRFGFNVKDDGGTAYGGADSDQNYRLIFFAVATVGLNHAPSGSDSSIRLLESGTYQFGADNFWFNDTDPNNFLAVKVTTLPTRGKLWADNVAVTAGQFIPVTDIRAGKLKFVPASGDSGDPSTSFTFQVQDDGGTGVVNGVAGVDLDSTPNTMTINVQMIDHPPSGLNKTVTLPQNTSYVISIADFSFIDPINNPPNNMIGVLITTAPKVGTLKVGGQPVTDGTFIPAWQLTGGNLIYTPPPNTIGYPVGSFTFQVRDDGLTLFGGINTDPEPKTFAFVTPGPYPPPNGSDTTVTTLEDTAYTFQVADFYQKTPYVNPPPSHGTIQPPTPNLNNLLAVKLTSRPALGVVTDAGYPVVAGQVIPAADITSGKLQFRPAGNDNSAAYTSFTFQVQDDGGTAAVNGVARVDLDLTPNTIAVQVTPVNDPPTGKDVTKTIFSIGSPFTFHTADFGFSDNNDVPANQLLAIKATTVPSGGSLTNAGVAVTAGQLLMPADVAAGRLLYVPPATISGYGPFDSFTFQLQDNGGTVSGGVDLDPTPRKFTFSLDIACSCPVTTQATLSTLEDTPYQFKLDDFVLTNGTQTATSIWIETVPGNNGYLRMQGVPIQPGTLIPTSNIANGNLEFIPPLDFSGVSAGGFSYRAIYDQFTQGPSKSIAFNILSVNDPPRGANNAVTTAEDQSYTFQSADFGFGDPSDAPNSQQFLGVKITTLPVQGALWVNGTAVPAGQIVPTGDIAAGRLVYSPVPNFFGASAASIQFQVKDDGGTANGGADLDLIPNTITINVSPANDPPSGANKTVNLAQNTSYTISIGDFSFIDPIDNPANSMVGVLITTAPKAGWLSLNGQPVTDGQFIVVSQLFGGLVYTPPPNTIGYPVGSFTFQVRDDGGTFNGGSDTDPVPKTFAFVTPGPYPPPNGSDTTVTILEDAAYTFQVTDFYQQAPIVNPPPSHGTIQPPTPNVYSLLSVKIVTLPANGSLTDGAAAVSSGQLIPVADITGGKLKFTPSSDKNGTPLTNFTFQVQDSGGTTSDGRSDIDPTPNTVTLNVTPINDAPAGLAGATSKMLQLLHSFVTPAFAVTHVFTRTDFGFTDPADMPKPNNLLNVSLTALSQPFGSLTYLGNPVAGPTVITAADIDAGKLVYTAPTAFGVTSFSFRVQDDGGTANNGTDADPTLRTMNILVGQPLFGAPVGANGSVTTLEDTAYLFQASDFGFSDVDSPPNNFAAVKISRLPAKGQLTNNGLAVTQSQFISVADILLGKLRYLPPPNSNGPDFDSFGFQVQDDGDVSFGGTNLDPLPKTLTIHVTSVNDAPTSQNKTVTMLEDGTYTFQATDFLFIDGADTASGPNIFFAVVVASLPATGTLKLGNTALTAAMLPFPIQISNISQLTYTPAANVNDANLPRDSFTFRVQDNGGTANGGTDTSATPNTMTVSITPVNDPPSGYDQWIGLNEDSPYAFNNSSFLWTDPVDFGANSLRAVRITALPFNGSLRLNGNPVALGDFVLANQIPGLVFLPNANANQSNTSAPQIAFQVQDDGGTTNGGIDLDPSPNTLTFNVFSINDAPIGFNSTVTMPEDATFAFSASNFGFTDPNDNPPNALAAIVITSLPTSGTLRVGGIALSASNLATAGIVNAGNISQLTFTPDINKNNGNQFPPAFTFRVRDNGGTVNGGIDTSITPSTITVSVVSVNDAPVSANGSVTTAEDSYYTFTAADFPFFDPNDTPANVLMNIRIATLPARGMLTNGGFPVAPGTTIPLANILSGQLRFLPAMNENGAAYSAFTFQVQDDGGTANGGIDLAFTPGTITINVTPINDAPLSANTTLSVVADSVFTFSLSNFPFADPSDSPPNMFLAVKLMSLPAQGNLSLSGVPVIIGQTVTAFDLASGRLTYVPPLNAPSGPIAAFTFLVQDNGGTANGGLDTSFAPNTVTINNVYLCGRPVMGIDKTIFAFEDRTYTFQYSDFSLTAPNDGTDGTKITLSTVPTVGMLRFSGVPVTPGTEIPASSLGAGRLTYSPPADVNGIALAAFHAELDAGSICGAWGTGDITMNVLSVNDPPSGTNNVVTTLEDTTYTLRTSDFGFSDPGDNPPNQLQAVCVTALPTAGSLRLNGSPVATQQCIPAALITINALTYSSPANANGSPYAAFTFQVQDNGGTANGGLDLDPTPNTLTINVTPVNDAPLGMDRNIALVACGSYIISPADFGFSDPFDTPTPNNMAGVKIASLPILGTLTLNGSSVTPGQFVTITDLFAERLSFTAPTQVFGGLGSIGFQVQDTGGTANGGVDLDPTVRLLNITNSLPPNPPPGAPSSSSTFITAYEDTPYVFRLSDISVYDPYGRDITSVTLTSATLGSGSLLLNGVLLVSGQLISLIDINIGRLVYTPPLNQSGPLAGLVVFQVSLAAGICFPPADETQSVAVAINVLSVNDPPSGGDGTVTTLEDTTYTFTDTDFSMTDANDQPSNALYAVKITTLPTNGVLTDDGMAVAPGQSVPVADIRAAKLKFTPAANANGFGYSRFTFQVQDNGGTANGGLDLDLTPNTLTINVTPVNDAPSGSDVAVTMPENRSYFFSSASFGFTDSKDMPANHLAGIEVTTLPANGELDYVFVAGNVASYLPVTAGQFLSVADLEKMQFFPRFGDNGTPFSEFTFRVKDDGGTADGGVDLDPTPKTVTLNVIASNSMPSFSAGPNQKVTDLSGPQVIHDWAKDISAGPPDESGQKVHFEVSSDNAGLFAAQPQLDGTGNLTFAPLVNAHGSAEVTVVLVDDGGTANGGTDRSDLQTFTIEVALYHPLHNRVKAADVNNDGRTVAEDALDIINYINANGSGPVDTSRFSGSLAAAAAVPPKIFYYDVNDDDHVSASDVLAVINDINANPHLETEAPSTSDSSLSDDTLLLLLATDLATQSRRK